MSDLNNSQTPDNNVKNTITVVLSIVLVVGIVSVVSAIICWVGLRIYPGAFAWSALTTKCNDIFTSNATFGSWLCYVPSGWMYLLFGCVAGAFINLMMWPFHVWQRNNKMAIGIFVVCLIPFYVFGLQLMGVTAAKIKANPNMTAVCNLDSYYGLMNNDCLWYGIIMEFIVIGIELAIAGIVIGILHMIDYIKHKPTLVELESDPKSNDSSVVSLETDLQMATGEIKN
jgi:hypothetical protein